MIGFGNRKLTHFLQSCIEMDYDSNNVVLATSAQVATPIMAKALVMAIAMPIYVLLGEKTNKFNGLNFKRW